jgi:hypothetical protein
MSNRHIALITATLITTSFAAGTLTIPSFAASPAPGAEAAPGGAAEVQILPNNKVLVLNLQGTTEFCRSQEDPSTCLLIKDACDFIVVDPMTGEISEPEPITPEAVAAHAGKTGLPLTNNEELLPQFKFGENECNLKSAAIIQPGPNKPHTVPTCTNCEVPASAGQPGQ